MLAKSQIGQITVNGFAPGKDVRDQTFYTDISLQIEIDTDGLPGEFTSPLQVAGLSGVYDRYIGFWLDCESRDHLSAELAKVEYYFPINIRASQAIEDQIKNWAASLQ